MHFTTALSVELKKNNISTRICLVLSLVSLISSPCPQNHLYVIPHTDMADPLLSSDNVTIVHALRTFSGEAGQLLIYV